jgi:hypothetical protein
MAGHAVEGLINWLRRAEWRAAFEDLMDEHLGEACEAIDGSADDLATLIGAETFMVLWGCVFEDFLTLETADGGNIVADYLKRRGFRETASSRAYMNGLRNSVMSLYEVSDLRPGESFLARDLIRGGEPIRVSERSGSRQLKPWDRIAARIVPVGPRMVMGGGLLRFNHHAADALLERLGRMFASEPPDRVPLAGLAPVFTSAWLADRLKAILDSSPPKLSNTDGHDILFTTARFPLLAGVRVAVVRSALDGSPELLRETASFWNWVGERSTISRTQARRDTDGLTIGSWGPDGSTVLGSVELRGRSLVLNVNSAERALRGQALLAPLLEGLVGAPEITSQTLDELKASEAGERVADTAPDLTEEQQRAILGEWVEQYYRGLLDEPIPMLGNATPRELAKEGGKADELAAWLKFMENGMAKAAPDGAADSYDLSWMWEELGIAALRR